MAEYPDYWPKQMRFREKKHKDDVHRRKTRYSTPGSYHQGYYVEEESNEDQTKTKKKPSIVAGEHKEYKYIQDYVNESIHRPQNVDSSSTRQNAGNPKNKLLDGVVLYNDIKTSFDVEKFIGEKRGEYILLFCRKYDIIGAFYNEKGLKFSGRDYGEDGSLRTLNKLLNHLNFEDKCVNLLSNEAWDRVLDSNSELFLRGDISMGQLRQIVNKLRDKEQILKVWHFPYEKNRMEAVINRIGSVKKL